jgi:hypothetical protein
MSLTYRRSGMPRTVKKSLLPSMPAGRLSALRESLYPLTISGGYPGIQEQSEASCNYMIPKRTYVRT